MFAAGTNRVGQPEPGLTVGSSGACAFGHELKLRNREVPTRIDMLGDMTGKEELWRLEDKVNIRHAIVNNRYMFSRNKRR